MLMSSHDGGIDLDEPVDVAGRIGLGLYLLEGLGEDTAQRVATEAGVDRLPWSVTVGQVTPRQAGAYLVDHPVDDLPVIHPRSAGDGPRYERSEQIPLPVTEFVSVHLTMIRREVIFDDGQ